MKRLSRKESIAIATIHDALREFRIKEITAKVEMLSNSIIFRVYPDTEKEAKEQEKILSFFRDERDTVKVKYFPATDDFPEFYKVELRKWLL